MSDSDNEHCPSPVEDGNHTSSSSSSDDGDRASSPSMSDITMDAAAHMSSDCEGATTASSDGEKPETEAATVSCTSLPKSVGGGNKKKRALPMKKRRGSHLDSLVSAALSATRNDWSDDDEEDLEEEEQEERERPAKKPKSPKKKRKLPVQSSKRRQEKEAGKIEVQESDVDDDDDDDDDDNKEAKSQHSTSTKDPKKTSTSLKMKRKKKKKKTKESSSKAARANSPTSSSAPPKDISSDGNNKNQEGIWPQLNDVLMGNSSASTFHHIGNRRFRVLVEANLVNYFADVTAQELLAAEDSNVLAPTEKQFRVVRAVVASVEGNIPPGRFLMYCPAEKSREEEEEEEESKGAKKASSTDDDPDDEGTLGTDWKVATRMDTEAKVHATFMAAGRFHVKQNAAALILAAAASKQQQKLQPDRIVSDGGGNANECGKDLGASEEEDGTGEKGEKIETPDAMEVDTAQTVEAEKAAEATAMEVDEERTADAGSAGTNAETNAAAHGFSTDDLIANALLKYQAKNRQVVAERTAAALSEEILVAAAAAKDKRAEVDQKTDEEEDEAKLPPASETPSQSDIDSLAKEIHARTTESMRIQAMLKHGSQPHEGNASGAAGQSLVPNYLPSRNTTRRASTGGFSTSLALPSSIQELYAISASSAAAGSLLSSRLKDIVGVVSPTPRSNPASSAGLVPKQQQELGKQPDGAQEAATSFLEGPVTFPTPPRIKVFLALPMDRFFVEDDKEDNLTSSSDPVPPVMPPSTYIMPSNYDVLCGPGQSFFHHIGNRRFRIMIEMNVLRYEKTYLASINSKTTLPSSNSGGEDTIQTLINTTLISLSRCDPPGRFLGMEMTTGRWRVLNPVFAQLKTEQTFFECLQVKQRQKVRQIEVDWKERIRRERELLLEELEGRMKASGAESRLANMALRASHRVSQGSLADMGNSPAPACQARNFRPAPAEEDLSTLQKQAKELLRRRQSCPEGNIAAVSTVGTSQEVGSPTTSLPAMVMSEQQERMSLFHRLQQQQHRRSSLPILSTLPSFSSQRGTPRRDSKVSSEGSYSEDHSSGSVQPMANIDSHDGFVVAQQNTAACSATRRDSEQQAAAAVAASPSNGTNGHREVKDLLDVVGGMMMMSRRSSV